VRTGEERKGEEEWDVYTVRDKCQQVRSILQEIREDIQEGEKERKKKRHLGVSVEEVMRDMGSEGYQPPPKPAKTKKAKVAGGISHEEVQAMIQAQIAEAFKAREPLGSVPYGLPTVALTRRTLDMQIKQRQVEMINDRLTKVLKRPGDYVETSENQQADEWEEESDY